MKKIAILLIAFTIAFSYSCKKEGKEVSTTISGQVRTNGTQDAIKMNEELSQPVVDIYHYHYANGGVGAGSGFNKEGSTTIDNNGNFAITLDLIDGDKYFYGVSNLDTSVYLESEPSDWHGVYNDNQYNDISPGQTNIKNIYINAKAWIRPRFINTNTDPNNNDVFEYRGGIGSLVQHVMGPYLHGSVDTTFSSSLFKTWSGTYRTGVVNNYLSHKVYGKLTRNGVTRDTSIIYTAPPFDTTVVEIRY
jgi:hypothetical protein